MIYDNFYGGRMPAPRVIAFFDFDGTLVRGDSLFPFLCFAAGRVRTIAAFATAFLCLPFANAADGRGWVKAYVLKKLLGGRRVSDLAPAIEKTTQWPRWKAPQLEALRRHSEQGHHVVIASGGLSLYLPALFEKAGLSYNALLCTHMQVEDGVLTGAMDGGNCVRAQKAALVGAYVREHGPFDDSWGYGNAPHDVPMMAHLNHAVLV